MLYTLDVPFVRRTGKVIGIIEYSIDDKWLRPKKKVGTYKNPLTDEMLNAFIEEYLPEEICLLIKDKKDNERRIDCPLSDFVCLDFEEDEDEDEEPSEQDDDLQEL